MVQRNGLVVNHHQEFKARGGAADLKKKMMKKSASMKRSELESLRSTNLTTRIADKQPGRPPPPADVALQKQSFPMARTPNYMKSTTSSDARKEQKSRVSFKNLSPESKATKTVSSLKTMRTLTKNSSFKIARASVRKCSPVVLCENLESQRATCSSNLKDRKFPAYLSLNPGGTESEGTSAIKVCPYTYCSLNGHHHPPLPPLKCFLSARRRMVKAQRGLKLENGGKLDDDFDKVSRVGPEGEEGSNDFVVEIFCVDDELVQEMVLDSPRLDGNTDSCSIDECSSGVVVETSLDDELMADDEEYADSSNYLRGLNDASQEAEPEQEQNDGGNNLCSIDQCSGSVVETNLVDEFMADEESLKLGAFSDDGESVDSSENLQGLNDTSQEAAGPEQEPASIDDNRKSLQKEDTIFETVASAGEVISDSAGNSTTTTLFNLAFESKTIDEVYSEAEDDAKNRHTSKARKPNEEADELGAFNPRPPNFLPSEADPESEKVDLRHQEVDERRNTEEWMVDYALRQVVAKLQPARKRKVALLVEAFEKVSPITKCELHLSHSPVFGLPSPVQACR